MKRKYSSSMITALSVMATVTPIMTVISCNQNSKQVFKDNNNLKNIATNTQKIYQKTEYKTDKKTNMLTSEDSGLPLFEHPPERTTPWSPGVAPNQYLYFADEQVFINLNDDFTVKGIDAFEDWYVQGLIPGTYGKQRINYSVDHFQDFKKGEKAPQEYLDTFNKANEHSGDLGGSFESLISTKLLNTYIKYDPFSNKPELFNFYSNGIGNVGIDTGDDVTLRTSYDFDKGTYKPIEFDHEKEPEQSFWEAVFAHPGESTGEYIGDVIHAFLQLLAALAAL